MPLQRHSQVLVPVHRLQGAATRNVFAEVLNDGSGTVFDLGNDGYAGQVKIGMRVLLEVQSAERDFHGQSIGVAVRHGAETQDGGVEVEIHG